ncbi:MAG TPA: M48 family metallopeptidase [Chloroflexota bacterium]|nr:M48 family metallopeptidase [Chloroflexota bacterium]
MATAQTTFRDLIAENKRNSVLLVAIFALFVAIVATVLSLVLVELFAPRGGALDLREAAVVGIVAAAISLGLSLIGYYAGDGMILAVSKARPVAHDVDPELFNVVEEMSIAAGLPMPKIYVIEDSAPNAFATGRDPAHASLAITSGLRAKLTRDELQGVVAHEMSHIRNFDTRLMLLMAVLVGTIAILADLVWQTLRFSRLPGGRSRDRESGNGAGPVVMLILLAIGVVLAIVAPILAQIIQLAVSRQREYLADASGVELTRYPEGLANALRKIDADPDVLEVANRGTAHLYIANPIKKFEERSGSIFASHPPIKERIQRLEALTV